MNLPLAFTTLTAADMIIDGTLYETYLNRLGINSIEPPNGKVQVERGSNLRLKFLNRGSPIHITVTSPNAGMFSDFFHENLFVVDEILLTIPIREDCQTGFFDIEIVSGYGVITASFRVYVQQVIDRREHLGLVEAPLRPVAHGRPHPLMVMMGIALILYCAWLYTNIEFLNTASFITLIVGVLYIWYRQA